MFFIKCSCFCFFLFTSVEKNSLLNCEEDELHQYYNMVEIMGNKLMCRFIKEL